MKTLRIGVAMLMLTGAFSCSNDSEKASEPVGAGEGGAPDAPAGSEVPDSPLPSDGATTHPSVHEKPAAKSKKKARGAASESKAKEKHELKKKKK